jgi:hypothetical protein
MDRMRLGVNYHVAKLIGEAAPGHAALESARYIEEELSIAATSGWPVAKGYSDASGECGRAALP